MRDSLIASVFGMQRVEHMTALFLVVLVLAWLVVFLPSTTRAGHRAPLTSTERFKRDLETIALPRHSVAVALSLSSRRTLNIRALRLALFVFMCTCVVITFGGFFVRGSSVLEAHLLADASLLLYVSWLLEEKRKRPRKMIKRAPAPPLLEDGVSPRTVAPTYWDVRVLAKEDEPVRELVLEEELVLDESVSDEDLLQEQLA